MAENSSVKRENRQLKRNLEGLLCKVFRYSKLRGVQVALYIDFTERGEFVSYETPHFSCGDTITAKKNLPTSRNYLPDCLPVGVQRRLFGMANRATPSRTPERRPGASSQVIKKRAVKASPLPSLPTFDFIILEEDRGSTTV